MKTFAEIVKNVETRWGMPIELFDRQYPWGGDESYLAVKKARGLGTFTGNAVLEYLYPTGGVEDDFSRRGFGPTGHMVRVTEGNVSVEFEI